MVELSTWRTSRLEPKNNAHKTKRQLQNYSPPGKQKTKNCALKFHCLKRINGVKAPTHVVGVTLIILCGVMLANCYAGALAGVTLTC